MSLSDSPTRRETSLTRLRILLSRAFAVFRRAEIEAEMNEEIRSHVEELEEDYRRSGLSAQEAHRRACWTSEDLSKSKNDTVIDIDCRYWIAFSRTLSLP